MTPTSKTLELFREYLSTHFPPGFDYEGLVLNYIRQLASPIFQLALTGDQTDHIAGCLHSMVDTWKGVRKGGSFVQAICNGDLMGAYAVADATNTLYMPVYVKFLRENVSQVTLKQIREENGTRFPF